MKQVYLYVGIAAVLAIIIGIILNKKKFRASLSKDGFNLESDNSQKTITNVENIKNQSEIDLDSPENRDIHIKDVDNSKINIKK